MPANCAVASCDVRHGQRSDDGAKLAFFTFPKDQQRRDIWIHRCARKDKFNIETSRVCSQHFEEADYDPSYVMKRTLMPHANIKPLLKETAVPSRMLPTFSAGALPSTTPRALRLQQRETAQEVRQLLVPESLEDSGTDAMETETAEGLPAATESSRLNTKLEVDKLQKRVQLLEQQLRSRAAKHRQRLLRWRRERAVLQRQVRDLRSRAAAADTVQESGVLSAGQLRRLTTKRRTRWTSNDVANALGLRCVSRKAYGYVRVKMGVPLPSMRTLSRWTRHFQVMPGFIEASARVLDAAVRTMTSLEKLVVVCFDEMSLDARWCLDQTTDQVRQAGKLQLVMARGLCSSWKQPCFFGYDLKMTPEVLADVIKRLEELGLRVVACVSDMGVDNENLWRAAGLGNDSSIAHPADGSRRRGLLSFTAEAP